MSAKNVTTSISAKIGAEDICYEYANEEAGLVYFQPFNCYDLECIDGQDYDACVLAGFVEYLETAMLHLFQAESSVHLDTTYFLARIAGLDDAAALTVATYDEATDLGVYQPLVPTMMSLGGRRLGMLEDGNIDDNLNGLKRDLPESGGFWFHYVPWYRDDDSLPTHHEVTVRGYREFLADPENSEYGRLEVPLVHLRNWAFAQGQHLCAAGLADELGNCLDSEADFDGILVNMPMVGDVYTHPIYELGEQRIWADLSDPLNPVFEDPELSTRDEDMSGGPRALGVYLHALNDRISHELCLDNSYITPTSGTAVNKDGEDVAYQYAVTFPEGCGAVAHALGHYNETGHEERTPDRTFVSMELAAREILAWAMQSGYTSLGPRRLGYVPAIINGQVNEEFIQRMIGSEGNPGRIPTAIGEPCANCRAQALCEIAKVGYGITWHGNPTCEYPAYPGDSQCTVCPSYAE